MLAPVLVTPPTADVVSIEEVRAHLRVDHSDDDAMIATLIKAAISHFDGYSGVLGRALVTQTWRQDLAGFYRTDGKIRLSVGPVQDISSVKYYDGTNIQQTLADTVWGSFSDALGPYVALKPGESWPSVYSRPDAVSVTYLAGYGDPEQVPEAIRLAIIFHVKQSYDGIDLSGTIDALTGPFRRVSI